MSADEALNEQVLRRLRAAGDDLTVARPVEFQFVFPSLTDARNFAQAARELDLRAEVADGDDGPAPGLPWDVNVTIHMVPELAAITGHERALGQLAAAYNGRPDGWFCQQMDAQK